jgi:hypothetical protein
VLLIIFDASKKHLFGILFFIVLERLLGWCSKNYIFLLKDFVLVYEICTIIDRWLTSCEGNMYLIL